MLRKKNKIEKLVAKMQKLAKKLQKKAKKIKDSLTNNCLETISESGGATKALLEIRKPQRGR